jgi:hypothetical protein
MSGTGASLSPEAGLSRVTGIQDDAGEARAELALTRAREAALAERARVRRPAVPDVPEHGGLRPDPLSAGTAAELIGVLRQFRTWAGNP